MTFSCRNLACILFVGVCSQVFAADRSPVDWVDPRIETNRGRWFFCTPGSRPFGLVASAPHTQSAWKGNEFGFEKDGRRITDPQQFREGLLADIEENARYLPIRIWGEAVFPQVIRQRDDYFHVYLIDAGFFDPKDRVARMRIQLEGDWEIKDRMTQEVLTPSVRSLENFTMNVPAGLFRLLEVRRVKES